MPDKNPSAPAEPESREAELTRREEELGRKIDALEKNAFPPKPDVPPIGGQVGT